MEIIDLKYLANEIIKWSENFKKDRRTALPNMKVGDEIEYILDIQEEDYDREEFYLSIVSSMADLDMVGLYNYRIIKVYRDRERTLSIVQQTCDAHKGGFLVS